MNKLAIYGLMIFTGLCASFSRAQPDTLLLQVQKDWAVANYELTDKTKIRTFETLVTRIETHLENHPQDVDLWVWSGIVKSSLAGARGGLGALPLAKASRDDLQHSLTLNDRALDGSAYTSLATLYHKVPGWPIGFGSDKKARELFQMALRLNPAGIDPNYFYGEFLYDEGEYQQSRQHLLIARAAAPRPNRPLADAGRQREIDELLASVEKKLHP